MFVEYSVYIQKTISQTRQRYSDIYENILVTFWRKVNVSVHKVPVMNSGNIDRSAENRLRKR